MASETKSLNKLAEMFNTTMQVDNGRHVSRLRTIDEIERAQDAGLKREHAKEAANDAWTPLKDRPVPELTEHQLRLHDKATGRAYYRGKPTVAEQATQTREIEYRRRDLGRLHGSASGFLSGSSGGKSGDSSSGGPVSGPLCWPVRDRNGKIVHHGAGPIYSEHQRYGAAYATAWEAARAKLNREYAKSDAALTVIFDSTKFCEWCGGNFLPERSTKRFCCNEHRVYASRGVVYQRPVFRCDEIFEIPSAPIAIPVRVPSHDQLCLSRRDAINDHICTCSLKFEKSVTPRTILGAKKPKISPKYEVGQAMAA
jgi:hypothetical protein